jgi:hypothetical protein
MKKNYKSNRSDHNVSDSKSNESNTKPSVFDPNLAFQAIVFGIISFILGVWGGVIANKYNLIPEPIKIHIGQTGHNPSNSKMVSDHDKDLVKDSYEFLSHSFYNNSNLVLYVEPTTDALYDNLFTRLLSGKVQIGFMSTYNYLCLFSKNDKKSIKLNDFKLIGYKKINGNSTYFSKFILDKNNTSTSWKEVLENIKENHLKLILSDNEYSSSSQRIPLRLLELNYLDPRNIVFKSKTEIIEMLKNNPTYVTAMSDEDWDYRLDLIDKEFLKPIDIEIPIPYDPIIVSSKWWESLETYQRQLIKAAFQISGHYCPLDNIKGLSISDQMYVYRDLMTSPIVLNRNALDPTKWDVKMPKANHDMLRFEEKFTNMDTVHVKVVNPDTVINHIKSGNKKYSPMYPGTLKLRPDKSVILSLTKQPNFNINIDRWIVLFPDK